MLKVMDTTARLSRGGFYSRYVIPEAVLEAAAGLEGAVFYRCMPKRPELGGLWVAESESADLTFKVQVDGQYPAAPIKPVEVRGVDFRSERLAGGTISISAGDGMMRMYTANKGVVRFVECDFSGMDLSDLTTAAGQVWFMGCKFVRANLKGATLAKARFVACDLRDVDMRQAFLYHTDLRSGNKVEGLRLDGSVLAKADMPPAEELTGRLKGVWDVVTQFEASEWGGGDLYEEWDDAWGEEDLSIPTAKREGMVPWSGGLGRGLANTRTWGLILDKARIVGLRCEGQSFHKTIFRNAEISDLHVQGCDFAKTWFGATSLTECSFRDTSFRDAHILGPSVALTDVEFVGVDGRGFTCRSVEWNRVLMKDSNCDGATFQSGVTFVDVQVVDTSFRGINVRTTAFNRGVFEGVDFSDADFEQAMFGEVTFRNCNFAGAKLVQLMFRGCVFEGTDLESAALKKDVTFMG